MRILFLLFAVCTAASGFVGCADKSSDEVPDIAAEDVSNGFLGISFEDEQTTPLKVVGTVPGSGAAEAGVKAGDLLLKVSDVRTPSLVEIFRILEDTKPKDELSLVLEREGRSVPLTVRLMSAADVESAMNERTSADAKQ